MSTADTVGFIGLGYTAFGMARHLLQGLNYGRLKGVGGAASTPQRPRYSPD
jgi:3-hydroxyisobutyrate dehydrogenase-like beta-hydroxyacid dehydrogenase